MLAVLPTGVPPQSIISSSTWSGSLARRSNVCGIRCVAAEPGLSEWVTCRLRWASLSLLAGLAFTPFALTIGAGSYAICATRQWCVPVSSACTREPFTVFAGSYTLRKQPKYAHRLSPVVMVMVWLFTPFVPYSGLFGSVRFGLVPVANIGMVWLSGGASGDAGSPTGSGRLRYVVFGW